MNSSGSTGHERSPEELTALLQLRLLLSDTQLNLLLPQASPTDLASEYCAPYIDDILQGRVRSALRELNRLNVQVVTVADEDYPASLDRLETLKPPMLFYRGDLTMTRTRMIAIVGTRTSTEYGNSVAEMLAGDFVRYDVGIISGLARGIDSHAHRTALEMGGRTIAVLGCGIDVYYPPRNAKLQERIALEGLLLSEFAPGLPAMPHHFLQRNRLIAHLSAGVIVVEAKHKSGTRKTVEWALDYDIPVFAVPGPIGRVESAGTNALIQDGAFLITSVRDALEVLKWPALPVAQRRIQEVADAPSAGLHRRIYQILSPVGMSIDSIARAARCSTAEALGVLAELEIDGHIRQLPGKRFAHARVQE